MLNFLQKFSIISICMALFCSTAASAQGVCARQYFASNKTPALGFSPSDIENLVSSIANAIGLPAGGIVIIPCAGIGDTVKVQSKYYDEPELPKKDFIFYDPEWVRNVVGPSLNVGGSQSGREEAIVLFGHELGHILARHWTANSDLSRFEKETEADRFAGCAAGALGVSWSRVEDLLGRVRTDQDTSDYPGRERSLKVAREGFIQCLKPNHPVEAEMGKKSSLTQSPTANQLALRVCLNLHSNTTNNSYYAANVEWNSFPSSKYFRIDLGARQPDGFIWPQFRNQRLRPSGGGQIEPFNVGDQSSYPLEFILLGFSKAAAEAFDSECKLGACSIKLPTDGVSEISAEGAAQIATSPTSLPGCKN